MSAPSVDITEAGKGYLKSPEGLKRTPELLVLENLADVGESSPEALEESFEGSNMTRETIRATLNSLLSKGYIQILRD